MKTAEQNDANDVLQQVAGMIDAAVKELRLEPGNEQTEVIDGFPFSVVGVRQPLPRKGVKRTYTTGMIRFEGRTLVVEDVNNGDWTGVGGYAYTVLGRAFSNGVARVPNVRDPDGGLLVFRYAVSLSIDGNDVVTEINPTVAMEHRTGWLAGSYPTAEVNVYDVDTELAVSGGASIYQLCAHYDEFGVVTIYQQTPTTQADAPGDFYNMAG